MLTPLKPLIGLMLFINLMMVTHASDNSTVNPTGDLSISQISRLVQSQNLDVKAAQKNRVSKNELIKQAGVLPNPDIELESENMFGSGGNKGVDNADITVTLGTLIELGGKRHYRTKAALLNKEYADLDYENILSSRLKRARQLSIEVVKQQHLGDLDEERLNMNRAFLEEIKTRVQKGRFNIVEQKRAHILVSQSELAVKKRKQELSHAKNQLSVTWGYPKAQFGLLIEDIRNTVPVPDLSLLQQRLEGFVELRLKKTDHERSKVARDSDVALGAQDVTMSGGMKHDNSTNDNSFVLRAGIPIAIFDQRTGAIDAARIQVEQKELELEQAAVDAQYTLDSLYNQMTVLGIEIEGLRSDIIPLSKDVFDTLQEGYLTGKFPYLAVLEAQKAMFEFKESEIETLAQYHKLSIELKRLTGDIIKGDDDDTINN